MCVPDPYFGVVHVLIMALVLELIIPGFSILCLMNC